LTTVSNTKVFMKINQKRIRNLERHLPATFQNRRINIGLTNLQRFGAKLNVIGFTTDLSIGETVLPSVVGPVTRFNAEGKNIVRRDLPKETVYRQIEWHWTERHGDREVEQSDFRYVPYERYPRDFVPPPSVELQIAADSEGNKLLVAGAFDYDTANYQAIAHSINVLLEIFGECEILTEDLQPIAPLAARRLNWEILPPGKQPWERVKKSVAPIIERAKKGNQGVILRRLEFMHLAVPELIAQGRGGFSGYIIFGFPRKNLYVLESLYYGNATYVFRENWEKLSQLTKAEILSGNLQTARIVHQPGWEKEVRHLLD
jgi:hypothetical protein